MRLALALAVLLAACSDPAPDAAAPPPRSATSGPSFTVGVDSLVRDEPERSYRVAIGVPQIRGMSGPPMSAALRAVNAAVRDTIAAFADDVRPEAPPPGAGPPMDAVVVVGGPTRTWISDATFSALVEVVATTGGARGQVVLLPLTYDLTTGAPVTTADLFAPGTPWADSLAAAVERAVRRRLPPDAFFADGLTSIREGRVDWTLTPDSLVVHVPPYQLSSSAAGPFHIGVSRRSLAPFARPGGRLAD